MIFFFFLNRLFYIGILNVFMIFGSEMSGSTREVLKLELFNHILIDIKFQNNITFTKTSQISL